jgi:hypothetical protein
MRVGRSGYRRVASPRSRPSDGALRRQRGKRTGFPVLWPLPTPRKQHDFLSRCALVVHESVRPDHRAVSSLPPCERWRLLRSPPLSSVVLPTRRREPAYGARRNAHGPGVHMDATGRAYRDTPSDAWVFEPVRPNAYGLGVGSDALGRPVVPTYETPTEPLTR